MIFPHLRTAEERYSEVVRSKYAAILLGGVLRGTKTVECAQCGWTTTAISCSVKSQLKSHRAGNSKCYLHPLTAFIGRLSKEEKRRLREAYGDFGLRWLLAGSEDMWRADLERARSAA